MSDTCVDSLYSRPDYVFSRAENMSSHTRNYFTMESQRRKDPCLSGRFASKAVSLMQDTTWARATMLEMQS